jgi:BMFP domain-containing protein YqiC
VFNLSDLESLSKKLLGVLPIDTLKMDLGIQEKFKDILSHTFSDMNVVTREEFDVQCKVLERTRKKLDSLEKIIAELSQEK